MAQDRLPEGARDVAIRPVWRDGVAAAGYRAECPGADAGVFERGACTGQLCAGLVRQPVCGDAGRCGLVVLPLHVRLCHGVAHGAAVPPVSGDGVGRGPDGAVGHCPVGGAHRGCAPCR